MYWTDEGFLLSKYNYNENSIIIEVFTLEHGKYTGVVYGGASRKQKRNFQIGNKIMLNWRSKSENKSGYFNIELLEPIAAPFFDDKKKIACILSSTSILKLLLPERQINKTIYKSFEKMLLDLKLKNWINSYIYWELTLIKELGFETKLLYENMQVKSKKEIKQALISNKNLIMENFIIPNKLKFALFRNMLERYHS